MPARPILSDIPAVNTKFEAGDRVIVKVSFNLSKDYHDNLMKTIAKFCQADVSILIVNQTRLGIVLVRDKIGILLVRRMHGVTVPFMGAAEVNCSKIELLPKDRIQIIGQPDAKELESVRRWVGPDIEVIR